MKKFIRARWNRNNAWNLIFSILLATGIGISIIITEKFSTDTYFPISASILFWLTIICVPYLVKKKVTVGFDKKQLEFIINDGRRVKTSGVEFMLMIFSSFGIAILFSIILHPLLPKGDINFDVALTISIFSLLPGLHCILRNFPIVVFFNKHAWVGDGISHSRSNNEHGIWTSHSDVYCNPAKSWHPMNIHHKR